jgi:ABC-type sulfate transport system permease subunit
VASPRAVASYELTFGAALAGAAVNVLFGTILAWTLVRYRFPGRRMLDALVDLPFALPTAVSGIALTAVYAKTGWIGRYLEPMGIQAAFSPLGVATALTFIGLPFVVRKLQTALLDLEPELEKRPPTLGASRKDTLRTASHPAVWPAIPDRISPGARELRSASTGRSSHLGQHADEDEISVLIVVEARAVRLRGATANRARAPARLLRRPCFLLT